MPSLSQLSQIDWDKLLAYNTLKTVQIRDKRLGVIHAILLVFGISMAIYYVFVVGKAYNRWDNAEGSVRFRLYPPVSKTTLFDAKYCKNCQGFGPDCTCRIFDGLDLVFPEKEETSMFVAFKIEDYELEHLLDLSDICDYHGECDLSDPWILSNHTNVSIYYPLAPETFQLDLSHQAFFPNFVQEEIDDNRGVANKWLKSSSTMWGQLLSPYHDKVMYDSPLDSSERDRFSLDVLLNAANMTADSVRNIGGLIRMAINYGDCADMGDWKTIQDQRRCNSARAKSGVLNSYRYVPFQVPAPHTHVYRVIYEHGHSETALRSRRVLRMTGLRIVFWITGRAGQFGIGELLIAIASISSTIAVISLLVDRVMIWLMPERKLYAKAKYASTKPFTKIRRSSILERIKHPEEHRHEEHRHEDQHQEVEQAHESHQTHGDSARYVRME